MNKEKDTADLQRRSLLKNTAATIGLGAMGSAAAYQLAKRFVRIPNNIKFGSKGHRATPMLARRRG